MSYSGANFIGSTPKTMSNDYPRKRKNPDKKTALIIRERFLSEIFGYERRRKNAGISKSSFENGRISI